MEMCAKNAEKVYTLSEIANQMQLNQTTCANIVKTLVNRNYLEQTGFRRGYRLGSKVFHLAGNFSFRKNLVQAAKRQMEEMVDELNETCMLSVLRKTDMKRIVLYEVLSHNELFVRTDIEKSAYSNASGRLLLAYLSDKEQEILVDRFGMPDSAEWPGVSTREMLFSEFKKIRENGISLNNNPCHIVGIAVPVKDGDEVIASLGLYMPEVRYRDNMKRFVINRMKQAADRIGYDLGN
jgi:DNA-binding IclR family transcriptional regulator